MSLCQNDLDDEFLISMCKILEENSIAVEHFVLDENSIMTYGANEFVQCLKTMSTSNVVRRASMINTAINDANGVLANSRRLCPAVEFSVGPIW